jgi:hypothetical protein
MLRKLKLITFHQPKTATMPAKITASTTNPQTGEISTANVQMVLNDYRDKITFSSTDKARNPVSTYETFDIDMDKIQAILDNTPNADPRRFRIHFSLNLPGQLSCEGEHSIQNRLSILISGVDTTSESEDSLLNVGDFILVDGFKEFSSEVAQEALAAAASGAASAPCCVQGRP